MTLSPRISTLHMLKSVMNSDETRCFVFDILHFLTSSSDMSGLALFFLPAYLNTDVRARKPKS